MFRVVAKLKNHHLFIRVNLSGQPDQSPRAEERQARSLKPWERRPRALALVNILKQ